MSHEKQIDDLHEALASTEAELREAREAFARVEQEFTDEAADHAATKIDRDRWRSHSYSVAEQRDTAQAQLEIERARGDAAVGDAREALMQLEAKHSTWMEQYDSVVRYGNELLAERDVAQAQLADAAGLLRKIQQTEPLLDDRLAILLNAFLARHAQGAQAVEFQREDRYIVIKRKDLEALEVSTNPFAQDALSNLRPALRDIHSLLPRREYLVIENDWPEYEPAWAAIQARVEGRAALATQPAAGEPVAPKEVGEMTITVRDGMTWFAFEEYGEAYKLPEGLHYLYTAPPAAAHGDDAVPNLVPGLQWAIDYCDAMLRQGNDRMLVEAIRTRLENVLGNQPAAMRAQAGEGGA